MPPSQSDDFNNPTGPGSQTLASSVQKVPNYVAHAAPFPIYYVAGRQLDSANVGILAPRVRITFPELCFSLTPFNTFEVRGHSRCVRVEQPGSWKHRRPDRVSRNVNVRRSPDVAHLRPRIRERRLASRMLGEQHHGPGSPDCDLDEPLCDGGCGALLGRVAHPGRCLGQWRCAYSHPRK